MRELLDTIGRCDLCLPHLPHGVRPVVQASEISRVLIIGQAPGARVHATGIPWNDPSGDRLREWLEVDKTQFYNPDLFAIMPMGFCYPGKGKSGDLPPRNECAPLWHQPLLAGMDQVKLILLVGMYAQKYYLQTRHQTLTETVKNHADFFPLYFPLPHPSPRNRAWFKLNPWFIEEVLPELRNKIKTILSA